MTLSKGTGGLNIGHSGEGRRAQIALTKNSGNPATLLRRHGARCFDVGVIASAVVGGTLECGEGRREYDQARSTPMAAMARWLANSVWGNGKSPREGALVSITEFNETRSRSLEIPLQLRSC
jgi:hypothetical protein